MNKEDKELLLKDLNARLPYGVYVEHITTKIRGKLNDIIFEHIYNDTDSIQDINAWATFFGDEYVDATYFRPFLRPMSSMTEEEKEELKQISNNYLDEWENAKTPIERLKLDAKVSYKRAVFYNSHHLDWNGLIEKNLALDCTGLHIYD